MVSLNPEKVTRRTLQPGSLSEHEGASQPRWRDVLLNGGAISHPSFASRQTEDHLFGPDALHVVVPAWTSFAEVGEDPDSPVTAKRRLSGREEASLFLQYNYSRYRLGKLLASDRIRDGKAHRQEIDLWFRRMMDCKETLARANMALVVAMAKRVRIPNVDFSELISEGNLALLRSIEKFDVSRGFKFSTYACRSILKCFNRLATKTARYRRLFPTEFDPELERSDQDVQRDQVELRDSVEELREVLASNRAGLSRMERRVVMERYAVGRTADKVRTLSEVGRAVGLTNERVRQLQNSALAKLRVVMTKDETDTQATRLGEDLSR